MVECMVSEVNGLGMVSSRQRSSDSLRIAGEPTKSSSGGGEADSARKGVRVKQAS